MGQLEETTAATVNTQPDGCHAPGAPLTRTVPLPKREEGDEYMLYYGLGLAALAPGSWLTPGTVQVDNVPKALSLSGLDIPLTMPFI